MASEHILNVTCIVLFHLYHNPVNQKPGEPLKNFMQNKTMQKNFEIWAYEGVLKKFMEKLHVMNKLCVDFKFVLH